MPDTPPERRSLEFGLDFRPSPPDEDDPPPTQKAPDRYEPWDLLVRYRDLRRWSGGDPLKTQSIEKRAVAAVIDQARTIVRHPSRARRARTIGLDAHRASGFVGEIDIEATLDEGKTLEDLRFTLNEDIHTPVIVALDVSLSMRGEKLALLAVSAAVLAMTLPSQGLGLLAFESQVHWLCRPGEAMDLQELVRRMLSIEPGGLTHTHAALGSALDEVSHPGNARAHVLLVSDGRVTEGLDPLRLGHSFSRLSVLQIGKDPRGRSLLLELARRGGGSFEVRSEPDLPVALASVSRALVR